MSVAFVIPWIPNSSKNRKYIARDFRTGRRSIKTADAVKSQMAAIAQLAGFARRKTFFDDDELLFDVRIDVPRERVLVRIESLGARPRGTTGRKRDIDNVGTTIQDALNGVVYRYDSQIRRVVLERFPEGLRA